MIKNLTTFWARSVDLLFDFIVGTFLGVLYLVLVATGIPMILAAGIGVLILLGTFALTRVTGYLERHRAMALHDVVIEPPVRKQTMRRDWLRPFAQAARDIGDPVTWKTLAHHGLTWLFGLGFVTIIGSTAGLIEWLLIQDTTTALSAVLPFLTGAVGLLLLVLYVIFVGRLDRFASVSLLGVSRTEALEGKVETLAGARQGAVSAADTERRRFERDLHDGVQPRLVSTALTLGMARARFDEDPEAARKLLDEAHEDIKESISDLRQLARGMHPAVLTDRGLDAALSAVASRSPIPVDLTVDLRGRLAGETEAVLYFVIAEALTNVAKHASATRAQVTVLQHNSVVRASVLDDGHGGAQITAGGGLSGISDRVRAAGGTFHLHSPDGGPTELVVEVLCAS